MGNVSITLSGIDEVIANLGYRPGSIKHKAVTAIRSFYSTQEAIGDLKAIDADRLIKQIWDVGNEPSKIRSKRRNFSSLRSSVNSDLTKLIRKDLNPESIIITEENIFDMTEEAKTSLLHSFTDAVRTGDIDLAKATDILKAVTDFLNDIDISVTQEASVDIINEIKKVLGRLGRHILDEDGEGGQGGGSALGEDGTEGAGPEEDPVIEEVDEDEEIREVEDDELLDAEEIELDEGEEIEEIELDEDEDIEEVALDEGAEEIDLDGDVEEIVLDEDDTLEEVDAPEGDEQEAIEDDAEEIELDEDEQIQEAEEDELRDFEEIELDEDEDIEEIALDEDEDIEEVALDEGAEEIDLDEDVEEIELDEDENLEDLDELDEEELAALEEFRRARELAEHFDDTLGDREKKFNAYVKVPKGLYTVGTQKALKASLALQQFEMPLVYMGKYPVTNALFEIFIEQTGYVTTAEKKGYGVVYHARFARKGNTSSWKKQAGSKEVKEACWYRPSGPGSSLHGKRNHPVVQVSVEDALAYASWIGRRLPTEAEWEAAARTDLGFKYPWGNQFDPLALNIEQTGVSDTVAVDEYDDHANEFGLTDMLGNVMEWTCDREYPPFKTREKQRYNVAKGGAWNASEQITISSRGLFRQDFTANTIGFRCISELFQ